MARLTPIESEQASPTVQALYKRLREGLMIEPNNFFKTMGHAPELLDPLVEFSRVMLEAGVLERRLKEWVILQIARLHHCDYVYGAHKQALSRALTSDAIGERDMPFDTSTLTAADKLAIRYAGQVSTSEVDDATYIEVAETFTPEEIVELTVLAGYYTFICRTVNALKIDNDSMKFLKPQAVE
jgi:4-carboxymuconolactone decarboxylase